MSLKPLQHQEETINNLELSLKNKRNKALIVLPSGSGKTHTIAFHVNKIRPGSFLYIVHRNEILTQTVRIFKEVCGEWLRDYDIGIINQKHKQFNKPYLFATVQTLSNHENMDKMKQSINYVVIDEFHHAAARTYQEIIKHFKIKNLIGLTATPYRLDEKNVLEILDNNVVNEINIFDAIESKILVPFRYFGLYDNIDYSQIKFSGYKYNESDLDKKLIIHKRDDAVFKEYNERIRPEKRLTIAFCASVNHVKRITNRFQREGIKAIGITHKEPILERQEIIQNFRNGVYDILFTRDILNEGVDFPECSALMFLRPTISKVIFLQQLGRGLRKKEGKKDILVLDFIGNYHKAFEKSDWLKELTHLESFDKLTGALVKPEYKYNPRSTVIFDSRVVDIFEIQRRLENEFGKADKESVYKDYINCCDKENKPFLTIKDYEMSKYRIFSPATLKRMYGSWYNFLIERKIPYVDNYGHNFLEYYNTFDKTRLEENYKDVKNKWVKAVLTDGKIKIHSKRMYPPKSYFTLESKRFGNKYHISCYEKVYGSWENFLSLMKENKDSPRDLMIKEYIEKLQKKLGRKSFTYVDWYREYGGVGKSYMNELGGMANLRKKFGVTRGTEYKCELCGKNFWSVYNNLIHKLCSTKCRGVYYRGRKNVSV